MKIVFAVFSLIISTTFKSFSQVDYFLPDPWPNALELAKAKNQMLVVYYSSESEKCKLCNELDKNIFSNSNLMDKLSSKVLFYKFSIEAKKNDKELEKRLKDYNASTPSLLFFLPSGEVIHQVKLITSDFDLESMFESVNLRWDTYKRNIANYQHYIQNKSNPEVVKNFITILLERSPTIYLNHLIKEYLVLLKKEEIVSDETIDLTLRSIYYPDDELNEFLFLQLQQSAEKGNLYFQYALKEKILSTPIQAITRGTLESKLKLKKAINIANRCNQIAPNFSNKGKQIFDLYYHSTAANKIRFMKLAKAYYHEKDINFDKQELALKDAVFYKKILDNIASDTTISDLKKSIMAAKKNYFSNVQASNLTFIAKTILFQQNHPKKIEVGIRCAKKAVELAPNTDRMATYALLCDKNERYKIAYEMLLSAIETESSTDDKIGSDISRQAYNTFLKIQKMIPSEY
ncbi:hypothetical protein EMA8858_01199 [Emticicia aquatica]|uniref:DUF255 domain-containing protein n=1 Tax=Emticicia aquatica TaxID=1681835 RepID=A0ABN8EQ94_9BACT|nr:hypothetical protein [Emticicia aquatica]CAH0995079.1 hypothetical protein EMA8858_01199 [Emticicia aquatica]